MTDLQRDVKSNFTSVSKQLLPCSSFKPFTFPFENKTVLIALPISDSDILQLLHHCLGTPGHQVKSAVIVWLFELVLFSKPSKQKGDNKNLLRC